MAFSNKIWTIGEALSDATKQIGIERKLKEQRVIDEWRTIVGDPIANNAKIKRFADGKLTLSVVNSVWRQELSFGRERLRKVINDFIGEEVVFEIMLR